MTLPTREHLGAVEALTGTDVAAAGSDPRRLDHQFPGFLRRRRRDRRAGHGASVATLSDEQIARVRQRILAEPLLVGRLINKAGTVTGINVMFEFDDAREGCRRFAGCECRP